MTRHRFRRRDASRRKQSADTSPHSKRCIGGDTLRVCAQGKSNSEIAIIVSSVTGANGVALVELYELP